MKKHTSFSLLAVACAAVACLAACDLGDGECVDQIVGARFIVTPSQDDRVPAVVSVNGDDAGAKGAPAEDAATDSGASASSDASPVSDGGTSAARDAAADAGDAGSVYGDDLSCAEICRLGFGGGIDVLACDGPFHGTARLDDGDGGLTATEVTYADCQGVATVCNEPVRRHRIGHHKH